MDYKLKEDITLEKVWNRIRSLSQVSDDVLGMWDSLCRRILFYGNYTLNHLIESWEIVNWIINDDSTKRKEFLHKLGLLEYQSKIKFISADIYVSQISIDEFVKLDTNLNFKIYDLVSNSIMIKKEACPHKIRITVEQID